MNILKNKIVHCKTEEQAKKLMQIADNEGYFWHNGDSLTCNSYFQFTCGLGIVYYFDDYFEFEVAYEDYSELEEEEKGDVIEFTDLFTIDNKGNTKITNKNTTLGEKVLVKDHEDDDWQEKYFLPVAHGYVYATAKEDGRYPFAWKYGIKKEY